MSIAIIIDLILSAAVIIGIPAMLGWAIWSSRAARIGGASTHAVPVRRSGRPLAGRVT
jgi:hypothetical protein